ncbi:hypothetical protein AB2B38_008040 [Balneola sp. MJW-20]|uniref:hypothetical protein n=1 Tax=Gracilimonas aurantiaca TaxID=3234185 RepID=UPI003467DB5F
MTVLFTLILSVNIQQKVRAQVPVESDTVHPRLYLDQTPRHEMSVAFDIKKQAFYVYSYNTNILARINKFKQPDTIGVMPDSPAGYNIEVNSDASSVLIWDTGGGRVFEYQIDQDTLCRIDNSFEQKAFYNHAPVLTPDDRIWFMGGYGFFTEKNLLIYYDKDLQEWLEYEVDGYQPPEDSKGYLFYVDDELAFYYFDWIENYETQDGPLINVYHFDIDKRNWTKRSVFKVPEEFIFDVESNRYRFHSTGTHKYDPDDRLLMLENILSYDIANDQMIFFDRSKYDDSVFSGTHFYNTGAGHWYFLSYHPTNTPYLDAYAFTYDGLPAEALVRVDPESWYSRPWFTYLIGLFGAFMLGMFGYIFLKNKAVPGSKEPINLRINEGNVDLMAKGKKIIVTDPSEKEMWKLVHELLLDDQHAISMSDADERLFGNHVPISQRSRSRKKLIDTVHNKTGCEFLSIRRDDVDKRFKVLTIDPKCFNTDS